MTSSGLHSDVPSSGLRSDVPSSGLRSDVPSSPSFSIYIFSRGQNLA